MDRQVCSIERVDNGFILICEDGNERVTVEVVQDRWEKDQDTEEPKLRAMQDVFYEIMHFFGIYNEDHIKSALDISIVDREDFPVEDTLKNLKRDLENLRPVAETISDDLSDYEEQKEVNKV